MQDKMLVVLGGTFDPVHHGHLRLASEIALQLPEAEICLMPSGEPVHRLEPNASSEQRLEMIRLALSNNKSIRCDDFEVKKESPSYSLETLQYLRKNWQQNPIVWVLGKDAYYGLGDWHRISELSELCHILVVNRPGTNDLTNQECHGFVRIDNIELLETKKAGFELQLELPMLEISSTRIRELVKEANSVQWLTPDAVVEYIEHNRLYKKG